MNRPDHARPMTDAEAAAEAARIIADACRPAPETPTAYRDTAPLPQYGTARPVAQPGSPPMSQKATDASRLMLTAGLATVPPGLITIGVLLASQHADATVLALLLAAPAVPVLALARLLRHGKQALPDVHHHHYDGPVHQDHHTVHATTRGIWAKTTNQQ